MLLELQLASVLLAPEADAPCKGAPEAVQLGIEPPLPPRDPAAQVPPDALVVHDSAELQRALLPNQGLDAEPRDIVLAPGIYTAEELSNGRYLRMFGPHRLWAAQLGSVVLRFGIAVGGSASEGAPPGTRRYELGAQFHGLVFEFDDPDGAPRFRARDEHAQDIELSYAIGAWGDAANLVVADCELRGQGLVDYGVRVTAPEGAVLERLRVTGFRNYGVFVNVPSRDVPPLAKPAQLRDLEVREIVDPLRELPYAEGGIMLGASGSLERARVRDVHRAGIVTGGNLDGGLLRDLDVDRVMLDGDPNAGGESRGVGIYLDNTTRNTHVREFCVGAQVYDGVRSEWDNRSAQRLARNPERVFPRGLHNRVSHGLVEASHTGVWFDQGTIDSQVDHLILRNYRWAAIAFHHNFDTLEHWSALTLTDPSEQAARFYDPAWAGSSERDNLFLEPGVCALARDLHPKRSPLLDASCTPHEPLPEPASGP